MKLYSIIIQGQQAGLNFFQTYQLVASSAEDAERLIKSDLGGKFVFVAVVEVVEHEECIGTPEIIAVSGRSLFGDEAGITA